MRLSLVPRERRFYQLFDQQVMFIVSAAETLRDGLKDLADFPRVRSPSRTWNTRATM